MTSCLLDNDNDDDAHNSQLSATAPFQSPVLVSGTLMPRRVVTSAPSLPRFLQAPEVSSLQMLFLLTDHTVV